MGPHKYRKKHKHKIQGKTLEQQIGLPLREHPDNSTLVGSTRELERERRGRKQCKII